MYQTIKNSARSVELYQRNRVRSKERIPFNDYFVFLSFFCSKYKQEALTEVRNSARFIELYVAKKEFRSRIILSVFHCSKHRQKASTEIGPR